MQNGFNEPSNKFKTIKLNTMGEMVFWYKHMFHAMYFHFHWGFATNLRLDPDFEDHPRFYSRAPQQLLLQDNHKNNWIN